MAVAQVILKTNPHRPVDFKESAVVKVLNESGNLNVDIKEDGCQLNMVVEYQAGPGGGSVVSFLSREGKEFNGLADLGDKLCNDERWGKFFNPHLDAGLFRDNGGFLLQAEILIDGKVCAEISGDLRRKSPVDLSKVEIVVFDLIPLDAVLADGEYEVFQELRRMHAGIQVEALKSRFPEIRWRLVESVQVFSLEQLTQVYEEFRALGKEGGVAKDPLGHWKRGKKTGQWKIKPDDECDGVVTGLMWGTPGLSNEGKVIGFTVLTEHGVEVEAGGITQAQMAEFTGNVLTHTGMHNEDHYRQNYSDASYYQGWAVKITYMERLPSGSYRHPNFDSFRGITDPLIKE
ncbi:ATP-dependent DNA ligase [Pseudomonas phage 71PfluR64PP]|uniref:DNA ligase n=2 Tax=Pifdecavirus pv22PfluR64PP TaxID=2733656 RepID=A0A2S1PGT2_9CAUD|nr:ATP-dependent DNA ligase [Pseudomonas phage 71PfluR64PP]AWH15790.1 ATP-dependent DNA ligase [Pseudomonas phage 67PfluR64PP]